MRLDCPTCHASYEVPEARLAGRTSVRCAQCGSQWTPEPPRVMDADALPPEGFPTDPLAVPREPEATPSPRLAPPAPLPPPPTIGLRLAWAASVLVLALGLAAALLLHRPIARAWPPSLRVYAALGLAHTGPRR